MFRKIKLLVYGPSRTGKSSLVNTMMKAEVAPVGSLRHEPTTVSVNPYEVNLTNLPRNPASVTLFDIPGKYDCKRRMSDTVIKQKIVETMLETSNSDSLSGILIFESLPSQPTQLRVSLMDLERTFGPEFRKSAIVVLTKADRILDPEELAGAKRTAEEICMENNIPFIYLQNNHKDFTLSDEQYNEQFDALMDKVKSVSPYILREVQQSQRRVNELARQLEENVPRNRITVQVEFETEDAFTERVPVQRTKVIYKIPKKRQRGYPGFGRKEEIKTCCACACTQCHTETVTRMTDEEMEVEDNSNSYLNIAKEQVLQEIRNQYRRD